MAGLEVEGITPLAPDLERVYVGFVQEVQDHPGAENLKVCSVDVGAQGAYSIICGAPNVGAGQTVPVALEGAVLPGTGHQTHGNPGRALPGHDLLPG